MSEGELSKRAIRMEEIDDLVVKMLDVEKMKADYPYRRKDGTIRYQKDGREVYDGNQDQYHLTKLRDEWFEKWLGALNNTHVDKEEGAKITPNKEVKK